MRMLMERASSASQPQPEPLRRQMKKVAIGLLAAMALTSCALTRTREIAWTEETPLNSGEVISVERKVVFKLRSAAFNPLQQSWQEDTSSIAFVWQGNRYAFPSSVMVIAVSPEKTIHLIRPLTQFDTAGRGNTCRKPSYFEYVRQADNWVILKSIEPWAFGLPRNQMSNFAFENMPPVVTSNIRTNRDSADFFLRRNLGERQVVADYVHFSCSGKM